MESFFFGFQAYDKKPQKSKYKQTRRIQFLCSMILSIKIDNNLLHMYNTRKVLPKNLDSNVGMFCEVELHILTRIPYFKRVYVNNKLLCCWNEIRFKLPWPKLYSISSKQKVFFLFLYSKPFTSPFTSRLEKHEKTFVGAFTISSLTKSCSFPTS